MIPRFFLTIVVVQNVPLRMTDMAIGCDMTVSVTRSDVIKAEVGFPSLFSGVFGYFRFFAMLCRTPRVLSITSALVFLLNNLTVK